MILLELPKIPEESSSGRFHLMAHVPREHVDTHDIVSCRIQTTFYLDGFPEDKCEGNLFSTLTPTSTKSAVKNILSITGMTKNIKCKSINVQLEAKNNL
jgi:hypothetical protein